jgi:Type I restriction enzyme R protein N terminus (HSDR_N)
MAQPTTTPKLGSSDGELILVPAGKLRCYVHGVLRKETPEEHVRQRVARSLVEEYGYAKSDLHVEFPVKLGSSRKRADIAVFSPGAEHKQENVFIIVEAKREDVSPHDRKEGVEQLKSYLAACVNTRWGREMWAMVLAYSARQLRYQDVVTDDEVRDRVLAIAARAASCLRDT